MRFLELCEEPINDGTDEIVRDFVDFAGDRLGLERAPKIKLIRDPKQAAERKSFGGYMPGGGIEINIGNRHIMDVLRTLAHEMVHHKQDINGELNDRSGEDGSPQENEANAKAAVIMRLWAKMNPELFQRASILAESWSAKYKKSINCSHPKGFSQKAHCAGKRKHNEDMSMEMVCEDCGMCETHGDPMMENLRDWFKDKWVRFGPDGKIRGDCARGSSKEGKPKCLPQAKAHALGKKGRASAAARKRREDPNANRSGSAINVSTKGKRK